MHAVMMTALTGRARDFRLHASGKDMVEFDCALHQVERIDA